MTDLASPIPSAVVAMNHLTGAAQVYEELYAKHGYHRDLRLTHASHIIDVIAAPEYKPFLLKRGVLDVGCSHGLAVARLWDLGIPANGVDISPTAAAMAVKHRLNGTQHDPRCSGGLRGPLCFSSGPATALPFADGQFDAIMSSDMLEHIMPEDMDAVIAEFARVARRYVFAKVATRAEYNRQPIAQLRRANSSALGALADHGMKLHTTLKRSMDWTFVFGRRGFALLSLRQSAVDFEAVFSRSGWVHAEHHKITRQNSAPAS